MSFKKFEDDCIFVKSEICFLEKDLIDMGLYIFFKNDFMNVNIIIHLINHNL